MTTRNRLLALVALLLLVTACTKQPAKPADTTQAPVAPAAVTSVRLLTYPELPFDVYLDAIIPAFQEAHPQYRVEKVVWDGDPKAWNTAVDDRKVDVVPIADWDDATRTRLLDLTPYIAKTSLDLRPYGRAQEYIQVDGGMYRLPFALTPFVMVAHEERLKEAGVTAPQQPPTWDEFRALLAKLTPRGDAVRFGMNDVPVEMVARAWVEGRVSGPINTADDKAVRECLEYFQALVETDRSMQKPAVRTFTGGEPYGDPEAFMTRKAAVTLGHYFPSMYEQLKLQPVILPMPVHAGHKPTGWATPWSLGVAVTTPQADGAWAFVRYVAGPEGAELLARSGVVPLYATEAAAAAWKQQPGGVPAFGANYLATDWILEENRFSDSGQLESLAQMAFRDMVNTVLAKGTPIDEAMAEYRKKVEQYRSQWGR